MADRETRLARQLLAHKPAKPLLFDRDDVLQAHIESLSGRQVLRIDPEECFRRLNEDAQAGTAGSYTAAVDSGSPADLFQQVPSLSESDLVYIADIIEMVEVMAPVLTLSPVNLLGSLRDRVRGTVYVAFNAGTGSPAAGSSKPLCKADLFALGYVDAGGESGDDSHPAADKTSRVELFRYSLRNYKVMPGWLNSKYWANPERWNATD